jgi:hypothetical protein
MDKAELANLVWLRNAFDAEKAYHSQKIDAPI